MGFELGDLRDQTGLVDLHDLLDRQQPQYRANLTIAVADPEALWSAAAERLLCAPGMTLGDALDVIGPREDPAIAECIATLAMPFAMPGCIMDDFSIDSLRGYPAQSDITEVMLELKRAAKDNAQRRALLERRGPVHAPPPCSVVSR